MDNLIVAFMLFAVPLTSWAQTAAATGFDVASFLKYLPIAVLGVVGGLVSFYQKVTTGNARWLNVHELIGELITSGFAGFIMGLIAEGFDAPQTLTFAIAGIAGHMGSRGIFMVENLAKRAAEKKLGLRPETDPEKTLPPLPSGRVDDPDK